MKNWLQAEKRIILASSLLVLLTGILVSVAVTLPMYRSIRAQIEAVSIANARTHQVSLESQLGSYQAIAEQFSSRTEIRKRLEAWQDNEIDLEELRSYSLPRLQEPASRVKQLAAMFRVSHGTTIVALGEQAGFLRADALQPVSGPFVLHALHKGTTQLPLIKTSSVIRNPDGKVLGHDILFFYTDKLAPHLSGFTSYGSQAEVFLYQPGVNLALGQFGLNDAKTNRPTTEYLQPLPDNPELQQPGIHKTDTKHILIVQPFTLGSAILIIKVHKQTFYLPANHDLFWVSILILALLLLAIFVSQRALKPLLTILSQQTRQLEASLAEQHLAASVFENTREAIAITDTSLNIVRANHAMQKLCGHSQQELAGLSLNQRLSVIGHTEDPLFLLRQLEQGGRWQGEVTHTQHNDSVERISLLNTNIVHDANKKPIYYIHIFSDITARTLAERQVRHLATHDTLTGLLNRNSITTHIHSSSAGDTPFSILFIDLDNFKPVNDLHGHQAGDEILQLVADRLCHSIRSGDLVARLGGDEFLIVLDTSTGNGFIQRIASDIIHQLTLPFDIGHTQVSIGVSIGIAHFPEHGRSADALIRAADMAMYCAKRNGGNQYITAEEVHDP